MRQFLVPLLFASLAGAAAFGQHGEGEAPHRHHIAFLAGGSHNTGKNGGTTGADYEYRFARRFGAAATFEYVGGDFREDLFAFTAVMHPWKGMRLVAGPGFDRELREHESSHEPTVPETHKKYRGLFRFGGGYDLHLARGFTIGPDLAVDILKGEKVLVYGLNIGWSFGRH